MKQARRSGGLLQRDLADRIGCDVQKIKRLERGIGSVETLTAAMAALDFRLTGVGPNQSLTNQLHSRRVKQSLSLDEVARRTGLLRNTVISVENGGGSVASLLRLLKVLAPSAKRRAPERAYWGQGDKEDRDCRFTPLEFMENIYSAFGEVDLDPCAHRLSPVIASRRIMLSEGGDGLTDQWSGKLAFVNPPFSAQLKWLRRAYDQWQAGNVETVICLVPVRTDSGWFHETLQPVADIFFMKGRLKFSNVHGKAQHTPFSLMLLTLGSTAKQRAHFAELVPGFWLMAAD